MPFRHRTDDLNTKRVLARLFQGLHVDDREIDPELTQVLDAWLDFTEFGILPWDRNAKADDIIIYWKNAIRFIDRMHTQINHNIRDNQQRSGRQIGGGSRTMMTED